ELVAGDGGVHLRDSVLLPAAPPLLLDRDGVVALGHRGQYSKGLARGRAHPEGRSSCSQRLVRELSGKRERIDEERAWTRDSPATERKVARVDSIDGCARIGKDEPAVGIVDFDPPVVGASDVRVVSG